MSGQRWVQHVSGQGERMVVEDDGCHRLECYRVKHSNGCIYYVPTSDYRLCDPPPPVERWVDVTDRLNEQGILDGHIILNQYKANSGYRLRKVRARSTEQFDNPLIWAFLIEQREVQP
jgi:hypothetical protein